jgi:hypothetical protein
LFGNQFAGVRGKPGRKKTRKAGATKASSAINLPGFPAGRDAKNANGRRYKSK